MPFKEVVNFKCYIYDKSRRKGTEKNYRVVKHLFSAKSSWGFSLLITEKVGGNENNWDALLSQNPFYFSAFLFLHIWETTASFLAVSMVHPLLKPTFATFPQEYLLTHDLIICHNLSWQKIADVAMTVANDWHLI